MPLCAKHGQVYGEGSVCVKCAEEAKNQGQPRQLRVTPKSNIIPQKK